MKKQTILGKVPSKSNCYRIVTVRGKDGKSHGSLAKADNLKAYEDKFFLQCNEYRNKGIKGLFGIELDVYYQSNRPDLDNSLKIVLDCLQTCGAIENDRKCVEINARKFIDKENPRIEFKITQVTE